MRICCSPPPHLCHHHQLTLALPISPALNPPPLSLFFLRPNVIHDARRRPKLPFMACAPRSAAVNRFTPSHQAFPKDNACLHSQAPSYIISYHHTIRSHCPYFVTSFALISFSIVVMILSAYNMTQTNVVRVTNTNSASANSPVRWWSTCLYLSGLSACMYL
jgi:hypothetical protein